MTIIKFSEWLQGELDKRMWKPAYLAKKAGIDPSIVSRALNRIRMPDPDNMGAIARALDLPNEQAFRAAGYLPPDPSPDDAEFEEWLYLLRQLPQADRDRLLVFARAILDQQNQSKTSPAPGSARA